MIFFKNNKTRANNDKTQYTCDEYDFNYFLKKYPPLFSFFFLLPDEQLSFKSRTGSFSLSFILFSAVFLFFFWLINTKTHATLESSRFKRQYRCFSIHAFN